VRINNSSISVVK